MVGREKLMASDLLTYLMEERLAELQAEKVAEQELLLRQLPQTLEEAVIARFPDAPIALVHDIQRVTNSQQLQQLIVAVIRAADLATFERTLAQAASSTSQHSKADPARPSSAD